MVNRFAMKTTVIALVALYWVGMLRYVVGWTPRILALQYLGSVVWFFLILPFHALWLNRKPFFSYVRRLAGWTRVGIRQIVALLVLPVAFGGFVIMVPPVCDLLSVCSDAIVLDFSPWWRVIWSAAILGHVYLNRRILSLYFGRRTSLSILIISGTLLAAELLFG